MSSDRNYPNAIKRPMVLHGMTVGLGEDMIFDPHRDHTYCRICGAVFQSDYDRTPELFVTPSTPISSVLLTAFNKRRDWSHRHAYSHPQHVHDLLEKSGKHLTPEAANKLASFGIIGLSDMIVSDEHKHAYREAPKVPFYDVETF